MKCGNKPQNDVNVVLEEGVWDQGYCLVKVKLHPITQFTRDYWSIQCMYTDKYKETHCVYVNGGKHVLEHGSHQLGELAVGCEVVQHQLQMRNKE